MSKVTDNLHGLKDIDLISSSSKEELRLQALMLLKEGYSIQKISFLLKVTRQTIYNWIKRVEKRKSTEKIKIYLKDAPRSGRPAICSRDVDKFIEKTIKKEPEEYGYYATTWTADLIKEYLRRERKINISRMSVRRALDRLKLAWKRPRYILAHQAEYWRQSKGG